MNEFYTKVTRISNKTKYEITFLTNDRRYFDRVEETCRECIDEPTIKEMPKDVGDKTFDVGGAFRHLIWGCKVRMTTWAKNEYIELVKCNTPLAREYLLENYILNQDGGAYPAEKLFDKSHLDARWEVFKEENKNE